MIPGNLNDKKLLARRSEDGGKTWGEEIIVAEPAFQGVGWVSFGGGKTWPLKPLVWKNDFQYSSLSAGRPGTTSEDWIYMHFEGRFPQAHVARFNLSWLMASEPTGDGEIPEIGRGVEEE